MTPEQIYDLSEKVWLRAIGYESPESHLGCGSHDPDDCGLFREIHDEVQMFSKGIDAIAKEGAQISDNAYENGLERW